MQWIAPNCVTIEPRPLLCLLFIGQVFFACEKKSPWFQIINSLGVVTICRCIDLVLIALVGERLLKQGKVQRLNKNFIISSKLSRHAALPDLTLFLFDFQLILHRQPYRRTVGHFGPQMGHQWSLAGPEAIVHGLPGVRPPRRLGGQLRPERWQYTEVGCHGNVLL